MQLAIRAGRADEPLARLGVAELTADMLVKGTKKRNALALAKAIDFVGGTIAADAGFEATWCRAASMAKDAKLCLELVPEMVTQPSLPRRRAGEGQESVQLGRDPPAARRRAARWPAPTSRICCGATTTSAAGSTATRIDPPRSPAPTSSPGTRPGSCRATRILAVSGDVDVAKLKEDLERTFGGWTKAPVPARPKYEEPGLSGVEGPPRRQAGPDADPHPGRAVRHRATTIRGSSTSLVWNYALGGGAFSSRLMKVVRVEGGKTLRRVVDLRSQPRPGHRSSRRRSPATPRRSPRSSWCSRRSRRCTKDGPTEDEVTAAIANIAGGYGMRFVGADDLAAALVTAELHGFVAGVRQRLSGAGRPGDARRRRGRRQGGVLADAFVVVLVGDANDLEPQLKKDGLPYERVGFNAPIGPQPDEPAVPGRSVDRGGGASSSTTRSPPRAAPRSRRSRACA